MYLNISFDQELHFVLFYFKKIIFSCSVKKNQKMFFATETWSEKVTPAPRLGCKQLLLSGESAGAHTTLTVGNLLLIIPGHQD